MHMTYSQFILHITFITYLYILQTPLRFVSSIWYNHKTHSLAEGFEYQNDKFCENWIFDISLDFSSLRKKINRHTHHCPLPEKLTILSQPKCIHILYSLMTTNSNGRPNGNGWCSFWNYFVFILLPLVMSIVDYVLCVLAQFPIYRCNKNIIVRNIPLHCPFKQYLHGVYIKVLAASTQMTMLVLLFRIFLDINIHIGDSGW